MADWNWMGRGAQLIALERRRQIERLGWTESHDGRHDDAELVRHAVAYLGAAALQTFYVSIPAKRGTCFVDPFPWDAHYDKRPCGPLSIEQRLRLLEKAGALIAAEIDRLLRVRERIDQGASGG